jgi:lysyl-tRNA synthetase class II
MPVQYDRARRQGGAAELVTPTVWMKEAATVIITDERQRPAVAHQRVKVVSHPSELRDVFGARIRKQVMKHEHVERVHVVIARLLEVHAVLAHLSIHLSRDDQRSRFKAQVAAKQAGAAETMDYDEDYCRALEIGMPPTAGEGVGIDRLAMLLAGQSSIRDVILFPLMRPDEG